MIQRHWSHVVSFKGSSILLQLTQVHKSLEEHILKFLKFSKKGFSIKQGYSFSGTTKSYIASDIWHFRLILLKAPWPLIYKKI